MQCGERELRDIKYTNHAGEHRDTWYVNHTDDWDVRAIKYDLYAGKYWASQYNYYTGGGIWECSYCFSGSGDGQQETDKRNIP